MAQQKKNGIQPISYSRLHEKLGEANRQNHKLQEEVKELKEAHTQLHNKYWATKDRNIEAVTKLQMALAAAIILLALSILARFM